LRGLAAGSTTLAVSSAPLLSVRSSVTVSDTAVELSELQVLLVTMQPLALVTATK
jgi:hypothetical protein